MENVEPTPTPTPSHSHNYFKERYTHSNKLILASIILLFCVIILILFIHTYARCYLRHARRLHHRRHHSDDDSLVFYVDPNDPSTLPSATATATGLSASLIAKLPVFGYFPSTDQPENPLECAVCLSEFREGEIGRVLPKCHHAFHTDCIDMWFRSHITCPLCRATVEAPPEPDIGFGSEMNRTGSGETKPSFLDDIIIEYPFWTRKGSVGDSPSTQSSSSSFSVTRILPPFDGSSLCDGGGGGGCSGSDDELNGGLDETQRVGSEVTRDECDDVEIVEEPKS